MKTQRNRWLANAIAALLCVAVPLWWPGLLPAQNRTVVRDTLFNADGTRASGQMEIVWNAFTSADGKAVAGGKIVKRVTDGMFEVALVPNENTSPSGTSYGVSYLLSSGAAYQETWVVPGSGPVSINQVRAAVTPSPSVAISQSQLTLGTGLKSILGLPRFTPATRPPATSPGQCYFDTDTSGVLCSDNSLTYVAAVGGGGEAGIRQLNALSASTQWFATGASGTDFAISSSGGSHQFNLPNASQTARGVITPETQTIAGNKTFTGEIFAGSNLRVKGPSPWIDVRAHGAACNGTADDTAAIQAALDSVPQDNYSYVVLVPAGSCKITGTLTIRTGRHITIRGAGQNGGISTEIKSTACNATMIDAGTNLTNTFSMENIQLTGAGVGCGTGDLLRLGRTAQSAFDGKIWNVYFSLAPDNAIDGLNVQGFSIMGCSFDNNRYGLTLVGSNNIISGNRFYMSASSGVVISHGDNNQIHNNLFDVNGWSASAGENADQTAAAISLRSDGLTPILNTQISGNQFVLNRTDITAFGTATLGTVGASYTQITGNSSAYAGLSFVNLNSAHRTTVTGNRIYGSACGSATLPCNTNVATPPIEVAGASNSTFISDNRSWVAGGNSLYGVRFGATSANSTMGVNVFEGTGAGNAPIFVTPGATFSTGVIYRSFTFRNYENAAFTMTLDSGSNVPQNTDLVFADRGSAKWRFRADNTGNLSITDEAGAAGLRLALVTAGDSQYRSATAHDFYHTDGTKRLRISAVSDAILFGPASDTTFYRSAAGTLKTDGVLVIGNGSGNDNVTWTPEAGNPSCVAGGYKIWANSTDGKLKKCENGSVSNLDTASGAGGGYTIVNGDTGTATKTEAEGIKISGTTGEISTSVVEGIDDTVTVSLPATLSTAKTVSGAWDFTSTPKFSALTQGSLPVTGSGGQITQDYNSLFWDSANKYLRVGTRSDFAAGYAQQYIDESHVSSSVLNAEQPALITALAGVTEDNSGTENLRGVSAMVDARHLSGTRSEIYGAAAHAYVNGTGGVTNAFGVQTYSDHTGASGSVANMGGIHVLGNYRDAGAGPVVNNYGIKIEDQGAVGTNNWALRTGTGLVEFGDNLKFSSGAATIVNNGTLTLPATTDTLVGRATTDTLTNKTLNAEGNGNTITTVSYSQFNAAVCQNGTASSAFNRPAADAPVAACVTGTNTNYAVLQFAAATDQTVQEHFSLPPDHTGNVDLDIRWRAGSTSGSVIWALETACVAVSETADPSFNPPQTIADATQAVAYQLNDAAISTVTTTGCAAGEEFFFRFRRDADNPGDDMAGNAELLWIRFKLRRAQ